MARLLEMAIAMSSGVVTPDTPSLTPPSGSVTAREGGTCESHVSFTVVVQQRRDARHALLVIAIRARLRVGACLFNMLLSVGCKKVL